MMGVGGLMGVGDPPTDSVSGSRRAWRFLPRKNGGKKQQKTPDLQP